MTTRAEWETLLDRLAVDELISGYGAAVDDGDWTSYVALLTPDGRADHTSAGGVAGPATEVADRLASTTRLFPVRQHLIVNRRIALEAPSAMARADCVNPMRPDDPGTKANGPPHRVRRPLHVRPAAHRNRKAHVRLRAGCHPAAVLRRGRRGARRGRRVLPADRPAGQRAGDPEARWRTVCAPACSPRWAAASATTRPSWRSADRPPRCRRPAAPAVVRPRHRRPFRAGGAAELTGTARRSMASRGALGVSGL
ncbi:nuclear transport factor 2 family protein [Actinacidiphila glaucinigra]|uniref:nuclear transport factor 2 family protein n=1 Tax=Actinacidiphila glaucinigra TaxID=235986 RepID=UPI003791430E